MSPTFCWLSPACSPSTRSLAVSRSAPQAPIGYAWHAAGVQQADRGRPRVPPPGLPDTDTMPEQQHDSHDAHGDPRRNKPYEDLQQSAVLTREPVCLPRVRRTNRVVSVGASEVAWRSPVMLARLRKQRVGLNRGCARIWGLYAGGLLERALMWGLGWSRGGAEEGANGERAVCASMTYRAG
jgi:hypothetical protein